MRRFAKYVSHFMDALIKIEVNTVEYATWYNPWD